LLLQSIDEEMRGPPPITMAQLINRGLSAAIADVYLIVAYSRGGGASIAQCLLYLILPLACIWFSEEMGAFKGFMSWQSIDQESPGCIVAFLGWVLLLLPAVFWLMRAGR
jgi:hypothetical protein